ncbi:DNA primase, partial [Cerasicoccus arenae]
IKDRTVSINNPLAAKLVATEPSLDEVAAKEKKASSVAVVAHGDDHEIILGDRVYRVRGLSKNGSHEVLKINLRLWHNERFYLDVIDLYRAKERSHYIAAAASETNLEPDLVKRDLGRVLLALETCQEERLRAELAPKSEEAVMSSDERQAALGLLQSPNLLERILEDFARCGIVGESTNKLTGYLAAVSRKLDKPLAIIVQSTSAAGKTALMESVLAMMPEEERVKYSAMTGQSLYYLGETNLKHKILAIVEEEGAEKASYALKLLQSEGELTIASTGKDEQGRMKTEEYHVEGPVMIFLTTTAVDIDEELLNRCLVLSVDESREQTRAIHDLQREAETFEGLKRKVEREAILTVHRNAQRLLKSVPVVNPYARRLTFLSDRTRTRRDHMKYLTLIRTITLLHQYQRPLKERDGLQYIEVIPADIEAANAIAHEVLGRSLDELPPQTRRLLLLLREMVDKLCDAKSLEPQECLFSRRDVRRFCGWSEYQVRVHLNKLQEMEYVLPHYGGRGQSFVYELLFDADPMAAKPQLNGLIDTTTLHASSIKTFASRGHRAANEPASGIPLNEAQPNDQVASRINGQQIPTVAQPPQYLTAVAS